MIRRIQPPRPTAAIRAAPSLSAGWVYVLTNASMPGLVKIGLTTRNPQARAAELASATGVPTPFVIAWCHAVTDCAAVESAVHRMLDDRRVSGRREFFKCDVATARQVITTAAGARLGRRFRVPVRRIARKKRRRGGDMAALAMLGGVLAFLMLAVLKPSLPGWLPAPLLRVGFAVERMTAD